MRLRHQFCNTTLLIDHVEAPWAQVQSKRRDMTVFRGLFVGALPPELQATALKLTRASVRQHVPFRGWIRNLRVDATRSLPEDGTDVRLDGHEPSGGEALRGGGGRVQHLSQQWRELGGGQPRHVRLLRNWLPWRELQPVRAPRYGRNTGKGGAWAVPSFVLSGVRGPCPTLGTVSAQRPKSEQNGTFYSWAAVLHWPLYLPR